MMAVKWCMKNLVKFPSFNGHLDELVPHFKSRHCLNQSRCNPKKYLMKFNYKRSLLTKDWGFIDSLERRGGGVPNFLDLSICSYIDSLICLSLNANIFIYSSLKKYRFIEIIIIKKKVFVPNSFHLRPTHQTTQGFPTQLNLKLIIFYLGCIW